ncbi:small acid-soluble spore protein [Bacillus salacetis]|uniref:Small acid-soluble spore protein n=1 Tax=Bacillus salacetis TaxID=2315464 RepID=A0A3A1QSJ9_9BACI|nr:alpha/beta-type small acid-soluble spore protein [Bacillus salacetis]RIW29269.1 small acid-soluble spore protein [Bacillus salacetis]
MGRNRLLVPEARSGLNTLKASLFNQQDPAEVKYEAAKEQGVSLSKGYNGALSSHDAGKVGGVIGGNMVREMIKMAEAALAKKGE